MKKIKKKKIQIDIGRDKCKHKYSERQSNYSNKTWKKLSSNVTIADIKHHDSYNGNLKVKMIIRERNTPTKTANEMSASRNIAISQIFYLPFLSIFFFLINNYVYLCHSLLIFGSLCLFYSLR